MIRKLIQKKSVIFRNVLEYYLLQYKVMNHKQKQVTSKNEISYESRSNSRFLKKESDVKTAQNATIKESFDEMQCPCCTRKIPCKVLTYNNNRDDPYSVEKIPLYLPCRKCDRWLSHLEEDKKTELKGMCFECFEEQKSIENSHDFEGQVKNR